MPIQVFQIYLDKQDEPYDSGEKITGKFIITVTNEYVHKGIYIKFEGHAMIKCTEDRHNSKPSLSRHQFFFNSFQYANEAQLAEGTHVFPFEYTLPSNLPTSFTTQTAQVWYKLEVLLNKDPKPRREVKIFKVRGVLDLNEELDWASPISETKAKNLIGLFQYCCCTLNYVSLGLKLDQRRFIPGDKIICGLTLDAETMPLTCVTLSLIQETIVTVKQRLMIERRSISKLILPDMSLEQLAESTAGRVESLLIPRDALINTKSAPTDYNDAVKIKNYVKLSVTGSRFPYKVLVILTPIVIGSLPLRPCIPSGSTLGLLDTDRGFGRKGRSSVPEIIVEVPENGSQLNSPKNQSLLAPLTKKLLKVGRKVKDDYSSSLPSSPIKIVAPEACLNPSKTRGNKSPQPAFQEV